MLKNYFTFAPQSKIIFSLSSGKQKKKVFLEVFENTLVAVMAEIIGVILAIQVLFRALRRMYNVFK